METSYSNQRLLFCYRNMVGNILMDFLLSSAIVFLLSKSKVKNDKLRFATVNVLQLKIYKLVNYTFLKSDNLNDYLTIFELPQRHLTFS